MAQMKNIRIAVSGIYEYAREELPSLRVPLPGNGAPEWAEDRQVYRVYRPAPVLAAACGKFASLPLTHHHPAGMVDGMNFRELAVGWTGERPWVDYMADRDEVGIRSTVVLYDDEAMGAYERGEIQLSPGYVADFEWRRGNAPDGTEYDIIMRSIEDVNHLALLPCGRGGADAVVLDGAPEGNDNASKEHAKKEEGLSAEEQQHLHDVLKKNAVKFPVVEFSEENYKKYLATPIETPLGKVKLGENQFEKLKKKKRQDLIGAINETLSDPCFIAEEKGGTTLFVKSFVLNDKQKNVMSVVIKRDGLNISISTHEEREPQILSKIKKAGVLMETSGDDGTVRDERAADTTHVVSLSITDDSEVVKTIFDITRAEPLQQPSPDHGTVRDKRVAESTSVDELTIADNSAPVKTVFDLAKERKRAGDTIASATTFTSDAGESDDLLTGEIVIAPSDSVKTIFDIVRENRGKRKTVFDLAKGRLV